MLPLAFNGLTSLIQKWLVARSIIHTAPRASNDFYEIKSWPIKTRNARSAVAGTTPLPRSRSSSVRLSQETYSLASSIRSVSPSAFPPSVDSTFHLLSVLRPQLGLLVMDCAACPHSAPDTLNPPLLTESPKTLGGSHSCCGSLGRLGQDCHFLALWESASFLFPLDLLPQVIDPVDSCRLLSINNPAMYLCNPEPHKWAKMKTRFRWWGAPTSLALNIPHVVV